MNQANKSLIKIVRLKISMYILSVMEDKGIELPELMQATGMDIQTIEKVIAGKEGVSMDDILTICQVLNINLQFEPTETDKLSDCKKQLN